MTIEPGWYKDPAEPTTQRYWDGEGWIGDPIPADVDPPSGPPTVEAPERVTVVQPTLVTVPAEPAGTSTRPAPAPGTPPAGQTPAPPTGQAPPASQAPWPAGYPVFPRTGPAPRPHGLVLAGVGSRFVARLVDILAVLLLCAVANGWFAYQFWQVFAPYFAEVARRSAAGNTSNLPQMPEQASTLMLMILIVTTAVWFAYEVPSSANSGQTLGKRLLGIKVVRVESEERLGFGRAWRRWSRLGLPTLLWTCGIGFLLQFLDCIFVAIDRPLHQALHDKAAATVVVNVPRPGREPGGTP